MQKLPVLAMILLFSLIPTARPAGEDRPGNEIVRDRFIGAWRLASLEEAGADGKIHKADCTGLLVFTHDGHMSVQVMYQNPSAGANVAPPQYAQNGYEASFGTYAIDDAHTFTFHVEGALVRTLISKDLKRGYELSGKQLVVKSADPSEHWRVIWEHY